MSFFKRLFTSEATPDPKVTYTLVDGTYEKLAGEPFSLGTQLITQKLLGNEPGEYSSINTRKSVRLGVLRYFALLAVGSGANGLGAIITKYSTGSDDYENDRYGKNGVSARDFLWAFHIDIYGKESIIRNQHMGDAATWEARPKGLVIANLDNFRIVSSVLQRRATFPIIEDDDKIVRVVPSTVRSGQYTPFK